MHKSYKQLLCSFMALVILATSGAPVYAGTSWDGLGGGDMTSTGGNMWIDGLQAVQYTVVDKETGVRKTDPIVMMNATNKNILQTLEGKGAYAYSYWRATKIEYISGEASISGPPDMQFRSSTAHVPSGNAWFDGMLTNNFIGGNASKIEHMRNEVISENTWEAGGFMAYLAEQLALAAAKQGIEATILAELKGRSDYEIVIEPIAIWWMGGRQPSDWPRVMAITATEMGLIQTHLGAPLGGTGYKAGVLFSSWAPADAIPFGHSLYLGEEHKYDGATLMPYVRGSQQIYSSPNGGGAAKYIDYHATKGGKTEHHPNLILRDLLGIGIITPEGGPNVNLIATDLEAEFMPETNQIRVKAAYAVDAQLPYEGDGFPTSTLRPGAQYGRQSDVQFNPSGLPAYLPGLTNVAINLYWVIGDTPISATSIRSDANLPLALENAVQFKNPEEKIIVDGELEGHNQNASVRPHESMPTGEKYYPTVEHLMTALQRPDVASTLSDGGDGWVYFNLPSTIPDGVTGISVCSRVNAFPYYLSPIMKEDEAGGWGHTKPVMSNDGKFKIIQDDGSYKEQDTVESFFHDNFKQIILPLPTFNLKAGGNDDDDPVKLNARYDTTGGNLCISAPGIFLSHSAGTVYNPVSEEEEAPTEEDKPIATSHNITIRFKSSGTTTFTNGETITHNAGDVVTFSGLGQQSFTRYFGGWLFDEENVWTSNVRYFGNDDYENVSPSVGTEANLREQMQYYDLSDGATSVEPWCTEFPQPTRETTFEITYTINPSLDPEDPKNPKERIPDGESSYEDNTAVITITLGPEVNLVAHTIEGTAIAGSTDASGNPDFTKPYKIQVDAVGYLQLLKGLGVDSIDTDTRIYAAPALEGKTAGEDNPFSIITSGADGLSYEVPVDSAREIKFIESENDVLSSGANKSKAQPGYNPQPGVTLSKSFSDSYTFDVAGDFLIGDDESYKYIYVAYYVNPTNTKPGVPPTMPKETTYGDNFITTPILITKSAPPPPSIPTGNRNDPLLNCSIYRNTGGGGRFVLANTANKEGNSNTITMQTGDVDAMLKPGTEINPLLKLNPYGSSFTVMMPKEAATVSWGYKDYTYVYDHRKDYYHACGALYKIQKNDYPDDYWAQFQGHCSWCTGGGSGPFINLKNEYITKYMDVIDGKAVVRVQVWDVWDLRPQSEFHCHCEGEYGDGYCNAHCTDNCCPDEFGNSACDCSETYWEFWKTPDVLPTTYSVMFDNIYTNNAEKSRVFSTQGRGTTYDYLLAAGYGVGTVLRTRFLTDYQIGYNALESGGLGKSNNGKDFSMEGWMKFSMSSSAHNGDKASGNLTNGGYPLEQTSGDNERVVMILNGSTPMTATDGVTLEHMYNTNIVSNEALYNGSPAMYYGWDGYSVKKIKSVTKGAQWIAETLGSKMSGNKYLNLWYFRLEPKEQKDSQGNMVRQAYTNKNYPDAVKINSAGQALGQGKLPPGYNASPVERAMGYVGLKVYDIGYINNRYPNAGALTYGSESLQPMMGVCYLGNLAIVGSYENDAWVRPTD